MIEICLSKFIKWKSKSTQKESETIQNKTPSPIPFLLWEQTHFALPCPCPTSLPKYLYSLFLSLYKYLKRWSLSFANKLHRNQWDLKLRGWVLVVLFGNGELQRDEDQSGPAEVVIEASDENAHEGFGLADWGRGVGCALVPCLNCSHFSCRQWDWEGKPQGCLPLYVILLCYFAIHYY